MNKDIYIKILYNIKKKKPMKKRQALKYVYIYLYIDKQFNNWRSYLK